MELFKWRARAPKSRGAGVFSRVDKYACTDRETRRPFSGRYASEARIKKKRDARVRVVMGAHAHTVYITRVIATGGINSS